MKRNTEFRRAIAERQYQVAKRKLDEGVGEWIDTVQDIGDWISIGVGVIPGLNVVASAYDLASAGVDTLQGQYKDAAWRAGMGAVGLVPFGKVAAGAAKGGKALLGATRLEKAATKTGKALYSGAEALGKAAETGAAAVGRGLESTGRAVAGGIESAAEKTSRWLFGGEKSAAAGAESAARAGEGITRRVPPSARPTERVARRTTGPTVTPTARTTRPTGSGGGGGGGGGGGTQTATRTTTKTETKTETKTAAETASTTQLGTKAKTGAAAAGKAGAKTAAKPKKKGERETTVTPNYGAAGVGDEVSRFGFIKTNFSDAPAVQLIRDLSTVAPSRQINQRGRLVYTPGINEETSQNDPTPEEIAAKLRDLLIKDRSARTKGNIKLYPKSKEEQYRSKVNQNPPIQNIDHSELHHPQVDGPINPGNSA